MLNEVVKEKILLNMCTGSYFSISKLFLTDPGERVY